MRVLRRQRKALDLLLQRAHYFYDSASGTSDPRIRDVSAHPCIEELLLATVNMPSKHDIVEHVLSGMRERGIDADDPSLRARVIMSVFEPEDPFGPMWDDD